MANGITIGGLGSGLDTGAIIDALMKLERLPIDQLEARKSKEQSKLTALSKLRSLVSDLKSKAEELSKRSSLLAFNVTPSEEGVASFAATGAAQAGNHTLTVERLAEIDRWAFDGVTDPAADLANAAGQAISFDVNGTNYSITLQQDSSSLEDVVGEINELAGEDVQASIVNTGTEDAPSYKLVLTATESGENFRLTNIVSTVAGLTIDGTGPDVDGNAQSTNNLTVGSNAVAVIDGLRVERETNEFTDVIVGVSLTAQSADPDLPIQFAVTVNKTAIKGKLEDFVDSYNEVVKYVNQQSTYNEDLGPGGPLFGDSLLREVRGEISRALFDVDIDVVQNDAEGFSTLGLVGIKSQNDGTLRIDATVFDEKLADNLDALADLFVDSDGFDNGGAAPNSAGYFEDQTADSGLAATLTRVIDRMFKTQEGPNSTVLKGLFDRRNETYNSNIKLFNDQIANKERYLEQYERTLIDRFARLEQVIGGLQSQGASLQAALS